MRFATKLLVLKSAINADVNTTSHMLFVGHSLVSSYAPPMFEEIMKTLDAANEVDFQIIIGAPLRVNWDEHATAEGVDSRVLLPTGVVSHLLLCEAGPIATNVQWNDTRGYVQLFRTLGVTANPLMQTYWYQNWPEIPGYPGAVDPVQWRRDILAVTDVFTHCLTLINSDIAPARVYLDPAGDAWYQLSLEIENLAVPGLVSIMDLFSDGIHPNNLGFYFLQMVHFATVFRRSPVGLPWDLPGHPITGLTQAMATKFQQIAWDVVRLHPYAGVAVWPDGKPEEFKVEHWAANPGDSSINVVINRLPPSRGSAITNIEYRVDGGSWISRAGTTSFTISGLTNDVSHSVQLRAINSYGTGPVGDIKSATPEVPEGVAILTPFSKVAYPVPWPSGATVVWNYTFDVGAARSGRVLVVAATSEAAPYVSIVYEPTGANTAFDLQIQYGSGLYAAFYTLDVPSDASGLVNIRITTATDALWSTVAHTQMVAGVSKTARETIGGGSTTELPTTAVDDIIFTAGIGSSSAAYDWNWSGVAPEYSSVAADEPAYISVAQSAKLTAAVSPFRIDKGGGYSTISMVLPAL